MTARLERQFGIELELGQIGFNPDHNSVLQQLKNAVTLHGFVVLRDQRFTDVALMDLGRHFGLIEERVIKYSTVGPSAKQAPTRWHHHSNCSGSLDDWLLYYTPAVPESGGSIELFDAAGWFAQLSAADRQWARSQRVRHDFTAVEHAGIPPVADPPWHPMVMQCSSPDGVHESLYFGEHAVELDSGDAIAGNSPDTPLGRILSLANNSALYHLHKARPHDLLIWDLKAVAHRGYPWKDPSLRVIHEVVVKEMHS